MVLFFFSVSQSIEFCQTTIRNSARWGTPRLRGEEARTWANRWVQWHPRGKKRREPNWDPHNDTITSTPCRNALWCRVHHS